MRPLPLTVVSGYLGAGKTTLINRLLSEDHGLNLMVIVNDFGSINIDASLLQSAEEDTIALTNGCVCCTMGEDLERALDRALDRTPRPDHLIVETSGIADPSVIANTAIAEPELSYGGIVTLVDGLNAPDLLKDTQVSPQVKHQIGAADMVLVTKSETLPNVIVDLAPRDLRLSKDTPPAALLFGVTPRPKGRSTAPHPDYTSWQHDSDRTLDRATLGDKLENRPKGLYRLKGTVLTNDGAYEIHVVGQYVSARRTQADRTQLVALGPVDRLTVSEIDAWWATG